MIESNVIEWVDFGDSAIKIDSYSIEYRIKYFRFYRALVKNKYFSILEIIFMIIFFIQLISISITFINTDNDIILEIFEYLKSIILLFQSNINLITYLRLFYIISIIIIIDIIFMIIAFYTIKKQEPKIIIYIINFLNIIIYYYLIGPTTEICLMCFWCENGQQKFFKMECYSNFSHYLIIMISILILILYIIVSIIYSFYCNEIGSRTIDLNKKMCRIHNNYEIFCLIIRIIIFFFHFILISKKAIYIFNIIYIIFILLIYLIMLIYVYNYIYYYNNYINYITILGWSFCCWSSLCILLKISFKLNSISSYIIIGWIIIIILLHKIYKYKEFLLITEENPFEFTNIKNIEMFNNILFQKLEEQNNYKTKILLNGIIKNFEEYIINNFEINKYYQNLINNKYLNNKFNKDNKYFILTFIYIIYNIYLEKFSNKDEIALYMSYFLINKLNNPTYAIYLCSKIKSKSHINQYYKYLLSEDIKEYLTSKLKDSKKDSIKHVQIGSVILYYLYIDLLKIKIYEAIINQIEYFDYLKNNFATNKTTYNFLRTGEIILKTRKEIMIIWEKLTDLNPFSDEPYKDYILYIDKILQDETLSKEESKKFLLLKNKMENEKLNIYHSLFLSDISSVLLVDGNLSNGKILYASKNFTNIYNYNIKEILNFNIDDLLPNVIQIFHKELIDNAIKYSNINNIFKKNKNSLLKKKNGGLVNIELFVKPTPNLSYGLTYLTYLQKSHSQDFIIILDKDLKINGFSNSNSPDLSFTMGEGYNLHHHLFGYHIALIIPDILPLLEFKNEEFNIIKKDCEIKGYLYQINNINEIKLKVDQILDKIKNYKNNNNDKIENQIEENIENINDEYKNLIEELNRKKIKIFSIFYKVVMYSFIEGKYKYYRIYINDDIITENNNFQNSIQIINDKENKYLKINNKIKFGSHISKISKESSKNNFLKKSNINNKNLNIKDNINDSIKSLYKKKVIEEQYEDNKKEENQNINSNKEEEDLIEHKSNIIDNKFNRIKLDIINNTEIFIIKSMKFLSIIFLVISVFFMILNELLVKNNFTNLYIFLQHNIFFNITKMNVGSVYIALVNIKWITHACERSSYFYNLTFLYEKIIFENIGYLLEGKNVTYNFEKEFKTITNKKHKVEVKIYGSNEKEKYKFNLDNLLTFFINSGINILNNYPSFIKLINLNKTKSIDPQTIGLDELYDLVEQTYLFYSSGINGFKGKEKIQKIKSVYKIIPIAFLIVGFFSLIIFILYGIFTFRIHKIEMFFLDKLLNFNSINFNTYLKKLDDIKKKFGNENNDEEDKNDIKYDSDSKKIVKKTKINKNKLNKKKLLKRIKKIDEKSLNLKKEKITIMTKFFVKNNISFAIKTLFIIIISFSYYIISLLIEKIQKDEFLNFDLINDEMIGVFKESFDNYIIFKRELDLYEDTLTNCKIDKQKKTYVMKIPKLSEIKIPTIGNSFNQIRDSVGFKKETLLKLNEFLTGNACYSIGHSLEGITICEMIWDGILSKGMELTITKMGALTNTIVEELESINIGSKSFNEVIQADSLVIYEAFIGYYYQRAFLILDEMFSELGHEKLYSIISILRINLIINNILSDILFGIFVYLIYRYKNIFNSFLNFIVVLPYNYIIEDKDFYEQIIKLGNEY